MQHPRKTAHSVVQTLHLKTLWLQVLTYQMAKFYVVVDNQNAVHVSILLIQTSTVTQRAPNRR